MSIISYTKERSKELAEYLEECAASPLEFEGNDPLLHSSDNHIHLWYLEKLAEKNSWIDHEYKVDFINYILNCWKNRLKGLEPYQSRGYRLYVYSDLAPTISVVAETDMGFPYKYSLENAEFVDRVADVVSLYDERFWSENFLGGSWALSEKKILKVVAENNGSIGKQSANYLGLKVGELRRLIINMGLGCRVNQIRKRYKRRPADFSNCLDDSYTTYFYEMLLPPRYS